jgi:hypothetical protein
VTPLHYVRIFSGGIHPDRDINTGMELMGLILLLVIVVLLVHGIGE